MPEGLAPAGSAPAGSTRAGTASPAWTWAAVAGAIILVLALIGAFYTPRDPLEMDVSMRLRAPGPGFPFGTDEYGRDLLSRTWRGAAAALGVAALATFIGGAAGVLVGGLAAMHRGTVSAFLMRLMDALLAFPALVLALSIVSVLGPGSFHVALALGVVNIPVFARLSRSGLVSVGANPYVEASRAMGGTAWHIFRLHLLPNAVAPLLVQATASFAGAILSEAALSFIGLGTQPPDPSWGRMLDEARAFMTVAPWMAIFPGAAIFVTILVFNLLGDGLQDKFNKRPRRI